MGGFISLRSRSLLNETKLKKKKKIPTSVILPVLVEKFGLRKVRGSVAEMPHFSVNIERSRILFAHILSRPNAMAARTPSTHDRVLVLQATGKLGGGVARGLMATGLFEVYGTTRSAKGAAALEAAGVHAIIANYIVRADVDRAIAESGATKLVFLTDYVLAANSSAARETEQGKMMVDAAKAAGISHAIFLSIADAQFFSPKALHVHAKLAIEAYLKESGLRYSILRPYVFFENLDDAANWNPL